MQGFDLALFEENIECLLQKHYSFVEIYDIHYFIDCRYLLPLPFNGLPVGLERRAFNDSVNGGFQVAKEGDPLL